MVWWWSSNNRVSKVQVLDFGLDLDFCLTITLLFSAVSCLVLCQTDCDSPDTMVYSMSDCLNFIYICPPSLYLSRENGFYQVGEIEWETNSGMEVIYNFSPENIENHWIFNEAFCLHKRSSPTFIVSLCQLVWILFR